MPPSPRELDHRIPEPSVRRLLVYLRLSEELAAKGRATVSSSELAKLTGGASPQVRRDLLFLGAVGKRGQGYPVSLLIQSIKEVLRLGQVRGLYIVGVGKLGQALARYGAFERRGFRILGLFDTSRSLVGKDVNGHKVRDITSLVKYASVERPSLAVLAVPATAAHECVLALANVGVPAILNFAQDVGAVPANTKVYTVDLVAELEVLAFLTRQ
jgi:redox-sensing transcriptional repressor